MREISVILDLGTWLKEDYVPKFKLIQEPFFKKELENPDTILILSGGHTNPLLPYISEAEYKLKLLISDGFSAQRIFVENRAIRTTQNLKFSFRLISILGIKIKRLIITGEESSKREVLWLAPKYSYSSLGYIPKIEYFGVPYLNQRGKRKKETAFYLIVAAYYFPPLDCMLTWWRKFTIRLKCFQFRKIICKNLTSLGCEDCVFLKHKVRTK